MVVINPLSSYLGGDDKDMDTVIEFRDALNKVLTDNNCAAMIIAHAPKTNFSNDRDYKLSDWQYKVAGSAPITNWARSMLIINPTSEIGTYQFIAAKRGGKIGWDEPYGYYRHSKDPKVIRWEQGTKPRKVMGNNNVPEYNPEQYLALIPEGKAMHASYVGLTCDRVEN